jgi:hypothetical protein
VQFHRINKVPLVLRFEGAGQIYQSLMTSGIKKASSRQAREQENCIVERFAVPDEGPYPIRKNSLLGYDFLNISYTCTCCHIRCLCYLLKPHCIRCSHFKVDDVSALEATSKPPVRIVEDNVTASLH